MSKVAIQGNASGTGTFTIAAPNSNTDRTLTLPDEAGTVLTSASDIPSDNLTGSVTVDGSGNVGIGTSSPVSSLEIFKNTGGDVSLLTLRSNPSAGDTQYISFDGSAGSTRSRIGSEILSGGNGQLVFETRDPNTVTLTERMRIAQDGEVFMGTTSHYGDSVRLCLRGAGSNNGGVLEIQHNRNAGGGRDFIRFYNDVGGEAGGIEHSGTTSVSYQTSSDYRLKENIVDMTDAVDRVKALKPSRFNFIGEDRTVDGFLAHEAQAVVPESVSGTKDQIKVWDEDDDLPDGVSIGDPKLDENGNTIPVYQGIDQSKLVPLLTGALQEAIARIETLEAEVATLKGASA